MAHEQVEFDVDFEIDDDLVIEVENLLSFNDFEDIDFDDLILSTNFIHFSLSMKVQLLRFALLM